LPKTQPIRHIEVIEIQVTYNSKQQ